MGKATICRTTQCTLMHNHYKNVILDNKAFQYGNPQNLYRKDSPIHRLLLHRDFHGLFSPPKVLRIKKYTLTFMLVKMIFPLLTEIKMSRLRGECFLHFSSVLKCPECVIKILCNDAIKSIKAARYIYKT